MRTRPCSTCWTMPVAPLVRRRVEQSKSDWPDSSWWESDRNAEQYSFTFFTRCAEASRSLNDLTWAIIGRINDFNPNSNAAAEFTEVVKSLGGSVEDNGLSFCVGGPGPTDPGTGEMMA